MKRAFLIATVVAALTAAVAAQAKGPIAGTIDGPGLGGGMTFGGSGGEPGSGAAASPPVGMLAAGGGFFPATFGQTPDPMLADRPNGNLGPRYQITYRVPGPGGREDVIRQDLYPYAPKGPVTYTPRNQEFFGTQRTRGGWYQAAPSLKEMLVARGLPATAPSTSSDGGGGSGLIELWPGLAIAFVLGLVGLAAVVVRRRPRTATT
jgi:hypothetical protein